MLSISFLTKIDITIIRAEKKAMPYPVFVKLVCASGMWLVFYYMLEASAMQTSLFTESRTIFLL